MTTQEKINDLVKKRDNARTSEQKRNLQTLIDNQKAFLQNENKGLNKPQKPKNMKILFEITQYIIKTGKTIVLEKGLTRLQAGKIISAFPSSKLHIISSRIDDKSIKPTPSELKKLKAGLKAPATKGLRTLCAKAYSVTGLRKKDGTQKKGYVAKKGGKLVKKSTKKQNYVRKPTKK